MYRINTNNYVESWHRNLKTNYLKFMRKQRMDVILHILTTEVNKQYNFEDMQATLKYITPKLNKFEVQNQKRAAEIDESEYDNMMSFIEDIDYSNNAKV